MRRFDDAIEVASQAIDRGYNSSSVYLIRGLCNYFRGNLEKAFADFEASVRIREEASDETTADLFYSYLGKASGMAIDETIFKGDEGAEPGMLGYGSRFLLGKIGSDELLRHAGDDPERKSIALFALALGERLSGNESKALELFEDCIFQGETRMLLFQIALFELSVRVKDGVGKSVTE